MRRTVWWSYGGVEFSWERGTPCTVGSWGAAPPCGRGALRSPVLLGLRLARFLVLRGGRDGTWFVRVRSDQEGSHMKKGLIQNFPAMELTTANDLHHQC